MPEFIVTYTSVVVTADDEQHAIESVDTQADQGGGEWEARLVTDPTPASKARQLLTRLDEALAPFRDENGDVKEGYLNRYDETKSDFGEDALRLLEEIAAGA